jgi:hypothetical protein
LQANVSLVINLMMSAAPKRRERYKRSFDDLGLEKHLGLHECKKLPHGQTGSAK